MTTSEYHDHTDTSPHPLITHHTIPTPSPTTQRTQPAPQTLGTPSSWTQLARPRRPEIHEPISITELRAHNRQYIHEKVIQNHAGPHWELMANEIAIEVQQGRIEQTGSDGKSKIRRGEDWRRSGHNKACHMTDQPFHLTPDHYTWLAQHSKTPHDHWCGDTTTTVPIASYHSMTLLSPTYSYSHHRFPYEIIQTTTTRTSAPDSGCHYPVRLHTRDNRALPRTHPQSYPTDPNSQANALLLPQTFSDESAVQPYVPYTTKHSPTTTNFQHTHTHTQLLTCTTEHFTLLLTPTDTPQTYARTTHHYLHRRLLQRGRPTAPTIPTTRRTRFAHTIARHHQRMGSSHLSPTIHYTVGVQRNSTTQTTQTFRQQQSIHLLPRSLGHHHHTSTHPASPHTDIYPTWRQRCSNTCHHQGLREAQTLEQPDWITLDMAQSTQPHTDPSQSPYPCEHCRPIQQRRLPHCQTIRLAHPGTTRQTPLTDHTENHWRRPICPRHRIFKGYIYPAIPTPCSSEDVSRTNEFSITRLQKKEMRSLVGALSPDRSVPILPLLIGRLRKGDCVALL